MHEQLLETSIFKWQNAEDFYDSEQLGNKLDGKKNER